MASLNGVSIKNMKSFRTHEGPMWQGSLYLNNIKIGVWSNDSTGGEDIFDLYREQYDTDKLIKELVRLKPECRYLAEEVFMMELVELTLLEKEYKKIKKQGSDIVLEISDSYTFFPIGLPKEDKGLSDEEIIEKEKDTINKYKLKLNKETERIKHEIRIYRSLNDFIIGDPIDINRIRRNG